MEIQNQNNINKYKVLSYYILGYLFYWFVLLVSFIKIGKETAMNGNLGVMYILFSFFFPPIFIFLLVIKMTRLFIKKQNKDGYVYLIVLITSILITLLGIFYFIFGAGAGF